MMFRADDECVCSEVASVFRRFSKHILFFLRIFGLEASMDLRVFRDGSVLIWAREKTRFQKEELHIYFAKKLSNFA